ncbi:hypothetical protein BurJ1DRAFT_1011 [Burkholderiales bacterium JOSHI_001]|nr:hypothetical protein BurJ1DRAFT_1011 [Burkholderiales bacterium JOSHI_001]
MNLFTGEASDAFFGGEVPTAVHALVHQAAEAPSDQRATLLWTAQALAPACLATYYALYKHHAGRREFDLAERAAQRGLAEAALQAGLPADWRALPGPGPAVDFQQDGPARFWLFTLKALAFIHLRSGRPNLARELLAQIDRLDPQARIGGDVIAELLRAAGPPAGG